MSVVLVIEGVWRREQVVFPDLDFILLVLPITSYDCMGTFSYLVGRLSYNPLLFY